MRCVLGAAVWLIAATAASLPARAVEVAVTDPKGRAAPTATVVCVDPVSADPIPIVEGRAVAPTTCRRVRCDAKGFLPGEVELSRAEPRCALRPATIVEGEVPAAAAATGLEVSLFQAASPAKLMATLAVPKAAAGVLSSRFAFPPVRPGRYRLEVSRPAEGWSCRAELGAVGAGRAIVNPAWREPARVVVKVKGFDAKPAPGVVMRTSSERPPARAPPGSPAAAGAWACDATNVAPILTDAAGIARLSVDPSGDVLVVAGDWKEARGLAYATLERVPTDPLTLTLALPLRLRAKVVDDKDRPAACDAALGELPADVVWLTRALPGSLTKSTCDPGGALAFGPIVAAPLTVELRFRAALPMRVAVEAPAPGTTVDLGTLHVRSGESIRVVAQDESGHPVRGAKVTARGASGAVIAVAGTTKADGGVDLSGLPKHAVIALRVEAAGFLPAEQSGLELDGSPFIVKLSPGAAISGTVRDGGDEPIAGATIHLGNDTNAALRRETSGERGEFVFDGLADGTWRLTASAKGFEPSGAISVAVHERRADDDVPFTLEPAVGVTGRVVDAVGSPVAGARVQLIESWQKDDVDRVVPLAEAISAFDGSFHVSAAAQAETWLLATKAGAAPAIVPSPSNRAAPGDVVLTLGEPASLVVHLPSETHTSRTLGVRDGARIGRRIPISGRTEISLFDLAPGTGAVWLAERLERPVALIPGQTAEIALDAGGSMEGRVTFDGAPSPRTFVKAFGQRDGRSLREGADAVTDERGRFRLDGLAAGTYRVVAVSEDGRAERQVDLAEGEGARVDLVLRSVKLLVTVLDDADATPVAEASVQVAPLGARCTGTMSTGTWAEPGELGYELAVDAGGCLSTTTDSRGLARFALAAPGSFDLGVNESSHEPSSLRATVGEGTTTKRVSLTRKPDRTGPKRHVIANLRTDPPGLMGSIFCLGGASASSFSHVVGRFDCGEMTAGPGVIVFYVEGYGRGRSTFDAPATGELVVDVVVPRGGTIVVPVAAGSATAPSLVDAAGVEWSGPGELGSIRAVVEDVANVGRAWIFRDVPPGDYVATVDGKSRSPVPLASGGTSVAY
jgi:hypothetical protein